MSKVRVTVRPQRDFERVVEFSALVPAGPGLQLAGGLIALQVTREGKLKVELYRLDPNVVVIAPDARPVYYPAQHQADVPEQMTLEQIHSALSNALVTARHGAGEDSPTQVRARQALAQLAARI